MMTFGAWLLQQIEAQNLSGIRFAKRIGVSHTTVQAWVNDRREPSRDDMAKIAAALDIPVATVGLAFLGLLSEQATTQALPPEVAMIYALSDLVERLDGTLLGWVQDHYGERAVQDARDSLARSERRA